MLRRRVRRRWRRRQRTSRRERILVWTRSPFVAFSWATLLWLLAVFGLFQGASRYSIPRSPPSSSDLGGERRGVRDGGTVSAVRAVRAAAAVAAAAVVRCVETCVVALPSWLFAGHPLARSRQSGSWQAGIEVNFDAESGEE